MTSKKKETLNDRRERRAHRLDDAREARRKVRVGFDVNVYAGEDTLAELHVEAQLSRSIPEALVGCAPALRALVEDFIARPPSGAVEGAVRGFTVAAAPCAPSGAAQVHPSPVFVPGDRVRVPSLGGERVYKVQEAIRRPAPVWWNYAIWPESPLPDDGPIKSILFVADALEGLASAKPSTK